MEANHSKSLEELSKEPLLEIEEAAALAGISPGYFQSVAGEINLVRFKKPGSRRNLYPRSEVLRLRDYLKPKRPNTYLLIA